MRITITLDDDIIETTRYLKNGTRSCNPLFASGIA